MSKMARIVSTVSGLLVGLLIAVPANGQVINESLKLLPDDGADTDFFGISVAVNSGIIAVGAVNDDDNGAESGSAYLFDVSTGTLLFKLLPKDGASGDGFGISISMSNGFVAVGSFRDNDNGGNSGSVYLFDTNTGIQLFKLLPDDGDSVDQFGISVAIDDGVVAVGANDDDDNGMNSGSVYLFDISTGEQIFKLLANDGEAYDAFGSNIAISNGVVAIGATNDDDNGPNSGSVYLFDTATGAQITKVLPSDGSPEDRFGWSLSIDNGVVAVGVFQDDDNGTDSGSAYLFDALTGNQLMKLIPDDGSEGYGFGNSIDISNNIVVVGSAGDDENGIASGSAYVFDTTSGSQIAKLLAEDGAPEDFFGNTVAIDNDIVVVGAIQDFHMGIRSGSAYVFDVICPADLTGDFTLDFFDVSVFLTYFQLRNPIADFTGDGSFDFFDVSAFLTAFSAGCP